MQEKFQIIDCDEGDVVITFNNATFKLSQLALVMSVVILQDSLEELNKILKSQGSGQLQNYGQKAWLHEGVSCEVLKPSKNWQKGKARIKVTLEFSPDEPEIEQITEFEKTPEIKEPESPLDDLRRMINEATS